MWYKFFDNISLINLPDRRDRYWISTVELNRYNIPYQVVKAIRHSDGKEGLYQTMRKIFEKALSQGCKRILVFEDDCKFLLDPAPVMSKVVSQLPEVWDLLYLGCNLSDRPAGFYSDNLLSVSRALSTHAVAYSAGCMERILALPKILPIDISFVHTIQSVGRSFCVCPFLVSQHAGHSDIEGRQVDWSDVLEKRFQKQIEPLIAKHAEPGVCCRT